MAEFLARLPLQQRDKVLQDGFAGRWLHLRLWNWRCHHKTMVGTKLHPPALSGNPANQRIRTSKMIVTECQ
jgi:hypothetical protein